MSNMIANDKHSTSIYINQKVAFGMELTKRNSEMSINDQKKKKCKVQAKERRQLTSDALVATELILGDIADSGLAFSPNALLLLDE